MAEEGALKFPVAFHLSDSAIDLEANQKHKGTRVGSVVQLVTRQYILVTRQYINENISQLFLDGRLDIQRRRNTTSEDGGRQQGTYQGAREQAEGAADSGSANATIERVNRDESKRARERKRKKKTH